MYIEQKLFKSDRGAVGILLIGILSTILFLSIFIKDANSAADQVCQNQTTVEAKGQYPLSSPAEMVIRADGKFLFVLDSNVISVVDTDKNAVVSQMAAGAMNRGALISPDGSTLFVCALNEGQILQYKIDGNDPKLFTEKGVFFNMPEIQGIKGQPSALSLSSDGSTLYVADRTSGQIIAISLSTGKEIERVSNPLDSSGIQISTKHPARLLIYDKTLYILYSTSRHVAAYNLETQTWINTVSTGGSPSDMEIVGSDKLYVSRTGGLDILNSQTLELIDKIDDSTVLEEPKNIKLVDDILLIADQGKGSVVMLNTKSPTHDLKYESCATGRDTKWLTFFKDQSSLSDMVSVYASNADSSVINFSFSLVDVATDPVSYNPTARALPQVIASGLSPSKLDIGGTSFDILALVRAGQNPIESVSFNASGGESFSIAMQKAGALENWDLANGVRKNGDEIYKATVVFPRIADPLPTLTAAWGSANGQFNIVARDTAGQYSHKFPDVMFGDYPAIEPIIKEAEPITYISTQRLEPQIVMAGFSPCLIDVGDSQFDIIAVVREGVRPIENVTLRLNTGGYDIAMQKAGTLDNRDKVYKGTLTFPRGSFDGMKGVNLDALWGPGGGQFKIQAIDDMSQRSHDFPNIEFGDFPEYKP
ncbi:MAG: hypothetical protein HQK68_12045 [Desulfamplus sp.]|nr:hypothetical protein [Desulfamplus sp.]